MRQKLCSPAVRLKIHIELLRNEHHSINDFSFLFYVCHCSIRIPLSNLQSYRKMRFLSKFLYESDILFEIFADRKPPVETISANHRWTL